MNLDNKTLKVKCFITGEESIFSGDYLTKLIEKYGNKENILKYYITYKAKSLLFKGYSVNEIRKILVRKQINLSDAESEEALEIIKYWQEQKNATSKFKRSKEKVTFTKTDEDVTEFIQKWKDHRNNDNN